MEFHVYISMSYIWVYKLQHLQNGKNDDSPLAITFLSPVPGQTTRNDCIYYFREHGNGPFPYWDPDQCCKYYWETRKDLSVLYIGQNMCVFVFHLFYWNRHKPQTTEWPKYPLKYLALGNVGRYFLQYNIINFPGSVTWTESTHQPRLGTCELTLHHTGLATASWGFQFPTCPCRLHQEVTTTRNLWQIERVPNDKCIRFWVYCLRC